MKAWVWWRWSGSQVFSISKSPCLDHSQTEFLIMFCSDCSGVKIFSWSTASILFICSQIWTELVYLNLPNAAPNLTEAEKPQLAAGSRESQVQGLVTGKLGQWEGGEGNHTRGHIMWGPKVQLLLRPEWPKGMWYLQLHPRASCSWNVCSR